MQPKLHDKLVNTVNELRAFIARFSTQDVLRVSADAFRNPWTYSSPGPDGKRTLLAPYKQCSFLLSLLLATPEPTTPKKFSEYRWSRCCKLLEQIFGIYTAMYFAQEGEDTSAPEWYQHRAVVMPTFLHYHTQTRVFASVKQLELQMREIFAPSDQYLSQELGVSATQIADLILEVVQLLQTAADRKQEELREQAVLLLQKIGSGQALPTESELQSVLKDDIFSYFILCRHKLSRELSEEATDAFWKFFTISRGDAKSIIYPTEEYPTDDRPLVCFAKDKAVCSLPNTLWYSAIKQFSEVLRKGPTAQSFLRRRDLFLEGRIQSLFSSFLGQEAQIWPSACEDEKGQHEHDLIILWRRTLFVIEAKAGHVKEPFRDPDRAYKRIVDNFKSTVQEGYSQSNKVRSSILAGNQVTLFHQDGPKLITLERKDIDYVYCVIVTLDSFGPIATNLSILEREEGEEYPWSVTYYDLEHFFDGLRYRGWGGEEFCSYLNERIQLYDKIMSSEELEVAGIFLTHGNLDILTNAEADKISLDGACSKVFDDIWTEKHGGQKADLTALAELTPFPWEEPTLEKLFPFLCSE